MALRRSDRAFTLVEVMVTVLILIVLVALASPIYMASRTRASDSAVRANLRNVVAAATSYRAANTGAWPDNAQLAGEGTNLSYVASPIVSTAANVVSVHSAGGVFYATARSTSGSCQTVSVNASSVPTVAPLESGPCSSANASNWELAATVTTYAGSGTAGNTNGTGTAAQFNWPTGIAVDFQGNAYVADLSGHTIRKIAPGGVVTTLAGGAGVSGFTNATGTSARFAWPVAVTVDASGNVYVADYSNHAIRVIDPAGVVTTLAGSGSAGYADGTGAAAQFNGPQAVAVDSAGNVYVADQLNQRIRMVTSAGVVTTVAGTGTAGFADGSAASAQFNNPMGIAVSSVGDIYVGDRENHRIRKITPSGTVSTFAGQATSGTANGIGTAAQFYRPMQLSFDPSDNLYVADYSNHLIRKITPGAVVTSIAGTGSAGSANGTGTSASFTGPTSVGFDHLNHVLYVVEQGGHRVRRIA